jgi:heterodisulfide reductase subunit B
MVILQEEVKSKHTNKEWMSNQKEGMKDAVKVSCSFCFLSFENMVATIPQTTRLSRLVS